MKIYIKRTIITVLLLGLASALFWKDIVATGFFLLAQHSDSGKIVLHTIPQPYTLSSVTIPITKTVALDNINIPIPFTISETRSGTTSYFAGSKYEEKILLFDALEMGDAFFEEFEPEEVEEMCDLVSSNAPEKMCNSNYDYYAGVLSTHVDDVTVFSSREKKVAFGITSALKKVIVVPGEIREFSTEHIKGFWFPGEESNTIVFFDQYDKQYDLFISGVSTETVEFILSNITSN